jgi:phosphoserine aminotransferase
MRDPVWNFSAGPGVLPREVLAQAASELADWHGTGISVMEMSHRSKDFVGIAQGAEASLRTLLGVPDDHRVLFLQGGASMQFAAVPLNLVPEGGGAAFVDTGSWAGKAIAEAHKYCDARVVWSGRDRGYVGLPSDDDLATAIEAARDAAYFHITSNETIGGVQWRVVPDTGDLPLVADVSSDLLSRPLDISRFGVLYAGAQKNVGPAGLTLVIVRDELLGRARAETPSVIDYALQAESDSMLNTPPTFAVYLAGLVFEWLQAGGGLEEVARRNAEKAKLLYDAIDASELYSSPVDTSARSMMNVPFTLRDPALDERFLAGARSAGLVELKGHRSVGGMRASIYNAMPVEGVRALVDFMRAFEAASG